MSSIKEKIISVAEKEFAKKGFAGTRMDEIAETAKVNKATIYYQIGNKEVLYSKVLHSLADPIIEELEKRVSAETTPEKKMRVYISSFGELCTKNNLLTHFMRTLLDSEFIKIGSMPFPKIIKIIAEIIKDGEKQGVFRKVPIFMVHLQIVGTFGFFNLSAPARKQLMQLYPFIKNEGAELDLISLSEEVSEQVFSYILK